MTDVLPDGGPPYAGADGVGDMRWGKNAFGPNNKELVVAEAVKCMDDVAVVAEDKDDDGGDTNDVMADMDENEGATGPLMLAERPPLKDVEEPVGFLSFSAHRTQRERGREREKEKKSKAQKALRCERI